jgi:hypothetical protein
MTPHPERPGFPVAVVFPDGIPEGGLLERLGGAGPPYVDVRAGGWDASDLIDSALAALADAALAEWPRWLISGESDAAGPLDQLFPFDPFASEIFRVIHLSARSPRYDPGWLKAAVTMGILRRKPPYFPEAPYAIQARQLPLVIAGRYRALRLIPPPSPAPERLAGYAKGCEWLAAETGMKVLALVPDSLRHDPGLAPILYRPLSLPAPGGRLFPEPWPWDAPPEAPPEGAAPEEAAPGPAGAEARPEADPHGATGQQGARAPLRAPGEAEAGPLGPREMPGGPGTSGAAAEAPGAASREEAHPQAPDEAAGGPWAPGGEVAEGRWEPGGTAGDPWAPEETAGGTRTPQGEASGGPWGKGSGLAQADSLPAAELTGHPGSSASTAAGDQAASETGPDGDHVRRSASRQSGGPGRPFQDIEGSPHPLSPGENIVADRLSGCPDLAPLFGFNEAVETADGGWILVDLLWREGRLAVEIDGYAHHSSRHAFAADRERDFRLLLSGYRVMRIPHPEARWSADEAVDKIRRAVEYIRASQG